HVLLYVARAARKENEDDIDGAIVEAHADLKRHYCTYIAPNNFLWISSTFRINFSPPVRRASSNAVDVTNAHTSSTGGSKVTASLINPTCGGTEVTDTTYDMSNSTASNSTSGNFTSNTTLPNANMSGLADTGVTSFNHMLNTNVTPDVVTIPGQLGIHSVINTGPIPYISVVSLSPSKNGSATKNGGDHVVNVPTDTGYDVWLTLTSVHEFSSIEGVDSVLHDGPWMIRGVPIFLNKWPHSGHNSYARTLIEINACNDFSDNLSLDDCPKAPKRVVNRMDKGNGVSSGADDKGFIEVKKKSSGDNNGGNKNFKLVSVKPKTQYRPKTKLTTEGASQKTTPSVGKKDVSTSHNGTFSIINSLEALNVDNPVIEEVETGNKASTSGGKRVLVDDDGKPLENVDYSGDQDSEDEWRETYMNADYDSYDDDMYGG
ncbi:hypothetical protein Tco_0652657, partial [Tanacetum coccineum]